jgi:hypothetical protein
MLRQSSMSRPNGRNDYVVAVCQVLCPTFARVGALLVRGRCPIMGRAKDNVISDNFPSMASI